MKTTIKIYLIALIINFLFNQIVFAQCHIDDWTALKALYESTDGDNWFNRDGWDVIIDGQINPPVSCNLANLYGVDFDEEGRVVSLDFDGFANFSPSFHEGSNNLNGVLPSEMEMLKNLKYLFFNGNQQLTGGIPKELGNLSNLIEIWFNNCQIGGSIPSELGNLSNLKILDLGNNQLSGNIPLEFSNLENIEGLYLYTNSLSGNIPLIWSGLNNLKYLYLSYDKFTGSIPVELCNQDSLRQLFLVGNQLNGEIPDEIGNLENLTHLNLNKNQFNGIIPSEIGNLTNLIALSLRNNQFSGAIPVVLGNLNYLELLEINDNGLIGCYPITITAFCTQLNHLSFDGNPNISDDNNFDATWEDFCETGAGTCDVCQLNCETHVYPGDLNNDGIVNNQDVSLSGLFQYQTGIARTQEHQNTNWYAHPSQNWNILNNQNKDLKHHDCNGDGIIDENDQQVVDDNMGLSLQPTNPSPSPPESDYQVMLHPIDQIYDGNLVMNVALERRVSGDLTLQGGHFTVDYSDVEGNFSNVVLNFEPISWLGIPNVDLWYESNHFSAEKKIEVGFTKTNNVDSEGSGVIGQMILVYDNSSAKRANNISYNFEVNTIGVHQNNGNFIPIEDQQLEIIIESNICHSNLIIDEDAPFQNVYQSSNNIATNGLVLIGTDQEVEYNANRVRINSGFSVKAGAEFKVRSSGCN